MAGHGAVDEGCTHGREWRRWCRVLLSTDTGVWLACMASLPKEFDNGALTHTKERASIAE